MGPAVWQSAAKSAQTFPKERRQKKDGRVQEICSSRSICLPALADDSKTGNRQSCDQHRTGLRDHLRTGCNWDARQVAFHLAGNCLIDFTETVSDQSTATVRPRHNMASPANSHPLSRFIPRNLLHARALLRLARRRRQLAFAIAVTAGSAVATAAAGFTALATHVAYQVDLHASIEPLAPAPNPPAPPALLPATPHRLLAHLRINPLAGIASWYGSVWNGRKTASGEAYDEADLTAAHKSLPLGTVVRVTNLRSMRSVIVRINDRGALSPGRVIDLSSAAAREIGMLEQGLANVKLEILDRRRS